MVRNGQRARDRENEFSLCHIETGGHSVIGHRDAVSEDCEKETRNSAVGVNSGIAGKYALGAERAELGKSHPDLHFIPVGIQTSHAEFAGFPAAGDVHDLLDRNIILDIRAALFHSAFSFPKKTERIRNLKMTIHRKVFFSSRKSIFHFGGYGCLILHRPTVYYENLSENKEGSDMKFRSRLLLKYTWLSVSRTGEFLRQHLGYQGYILLLSVTVGLLSGLAAVTLKNITDYGHLIVRQAEGQWVEWLVPALPAAGIILCVIFVKLFVKGTYDKSLANVIVSTTNGISSIPVQKTYSHVITSGICVGLGGSAGLEAPIALTGSAIGSNVAKFMRTSLETRTLLLACGGGAGISAIFNSPVAGALFACEILLPSFSVPALVPLLLASATAAVLSETLYSNQPFVQLNSGWSSANIPFYIALGIISGLMSAYIIRGSIELGKKWDFIKNPWLKALTGGAILYLMFLLFPALKGEGYGYISAIVQGEDSFVMKNSLLSKFFDCSSGWILLGICALLTFLKVVSSTTTLESGGDGGIFAPSMFIGAFTGFCLARFVNMTAPANLHLNEINFIAVGMGGAIAGVMHAPMTGMFLIAEITGGYRLFIPLMITASLSAFISKKITGYNIYKSVIQLRGGAPEPNPAVMVLEKVKVGDLVEKDFIAVSASDKLRDLLKDVMTSDRNIFPVLDENGGVAGIVTLDDIRPFLLDSNLYDVALVYDVMSDAPPVLDCRDSIGSATRLFEKLHVFFIPVTRHGKYIGFISKTAVFDKYRELLRNRKELF